MLTYLALGSTRIEEEIGQVDGWKHRAWCRRMRNSIGGQHIDMHGINQTTMELELVLLLMLVLKKGSSRGRGCSRNKSTSNSN